MRIFAFILGFLLVASVSFAADIDGTWSGEIENRFGGMGGGGMGGGAAVRTMTFHFQSDGETLTGYNMPAGMNVQTPIRDGIIKDDKIWFLLDVNMGPSKMVFRYKGKVKEDKLKLSYKVVTENQRSFGRRGMGEQEVTLNRQ